MKRWIPGIVRLNLNLVRRFWADCVSGRTVRIVSARRRSGLLRSGLLRSDTCNFESRLQITQILKAASYAENKRHNLTIAAACIHNVVIQPGEIFSFWALVGAPIGRRGYREGRALVQGKLQAVMGGGLCQLSGILYHLSLQAGLTILERYPHSTDIYTDETRFTPLGSDATVVYGYKDFRIVNNLGQPLCFRLTLTSEQVLAQICTPQPIETYQITFHPQQWSDRTEVLTHRVSQQNRSAQAEMLTISHYRQPELKN